MNGSDVRIRQVTDPADPAIAAFGALQERSYADPDLLIPPRYLPVMLARQGEERRNLMLLAEAGAEVVGGGRCGGEQVRLLPACDLPRGTS